MNADRAAELLTRERSRIERELERLRHDADEELSHVDQHLADSGTELYEDERDEGLSDRLREELAAIERAERRLKEGTYGRSVRSGEPIPDARLEAVPWAELTVEEQARYERGA
jgi:DnaK suppressor protein